MGVGKRKDGKEGEVQGDEMERKEEKVGKLTAPWMMWGWGREGGERKVT